MWARLWTSQSPQKSDRKSKRITEIAQQSSTVYRSVANLVWGSLQAHAWVVALKCVVPVYAFAVPKSEKDSKKKNTIPFGVIRVASPGQSGQRHLIRIAEIRGGHFVCNRDLITQEAYSPTTMVCNL
jgi:predicted aspartyl protease